MIRLHTLRFQNIGSFGNELHNLILDESKSTLMVGKNGHGKSMSLDALCFGLYGRPFRSITKNQLINSITGKGTLVEVDLTSNGHKYIVRRGMKPNIFEIWKDGELQPQVDVREQQKVFETDVLGIDMKTFCQVVILGKASHVPFMQLPAQKRREMIEDILDLKVFSDMRAVLKTKADALKVRITETDKDLAVTRAKFEAEQRHAEAAKADTESEITSRNTTLETLNNELSKINGEIKIVRASRDVYSLPDTAALDQEARKLDRIQSQIDITRKDTQKHLKFYSEHSNCPTCSQVIEDGLKTNVLMDAQKKLSQCDVGQQKLNVMKEDLRIRNDEAKYIASKINGFDRELAVLESSLNTTSREISRVEREIKQINDKPAFDEENLRQLEIDVQELMYDKDVALTEARLMSHAANLLKDSGVKAKMIAQYIPVFNEMINKYLEALELYIQLELDEEFNETIKSMNRDAFTYQSFSEGEKLRIDLAILFSWREIARKRNSAAVDLLIFDEVLDGSIDENGKVELLKLLEKLTEDVHVFVISHAGEAYQDRFDRTLNFVKKSNFSQIEVQS